MYIPNNVTISNISYLIPDEIGFCTHTLIIGDGIENIYYWSLGFFDNLKCLYLGADVKYISFNYLSHLKHLVEIKVNKTNKYFRAIDNILFSFDMKKIIRYAQNKDEAFYEIPDSVEEIYPYAFAKARKLQCLKIGKNIKYIGDLAFLDMKRLRHLYIEGNPEFGSDIPEDYYFLFGQNCGNFAIPCDYMLVVGGLENTNIKHYCDEIGASYIVLAEDEVNKFLSTDLPVFMNDEYLNRCGKDSNSIMMHFYRNID